MFAILLLACLSLIPNLSTANPLCAERPFDTSPEIGDIANDTKAALEGFEGLQATLTSRVSSICISDKLFNAQGYFEPTTQRIVLKDGLESGLRLAVMVHELRHAEQHARGLCPGLSLDMQDYAQAVFAMEADASVTSLVVASKLREAGDARMWEALTNWPMQWDIAQRFDAVLQRDGSVSEAAHAAFDAWFERKDRTDAYYVSTCLEYLDATEEQHLLPQYGRLVPSFLEDLCTLPDGTPYNCTLPE